MSGLSSGGLTPDLRSMSPDQEPNAMKDLLSALSSIGGGEGPVQEKATKVSQRILYIVGWNGNEISSRLVVVVVKCIQLLWWR